MRHLCFNVAVLLASLLMATLVGCSSNQPNLGPASWYRGTVSIDPPDATIFGPPGDVAIEWQRLPSQNLWIWRENRKLGWNQQTIWQAAPEQPGTFLAEVSSGAWSGVVTIQDWQSTGLYSPGGWQEKMLLTNNNTGYIEGTGETDDPGLEADQSTTNPSPLERVWITWKWIRLDGSVGATMKQTLNSCNEEEYIAAMQRLGGTLPQPNR